jgi:hypothetical protein
LRHEDVRQTLRKYKYPPDKTPGAVELILKQAEVVSHIFDISPLVIAGGIAF